MKKLLTIFTLMTILAVNTGFSQIKYPVTRKVDTVTNYFGTKVADPYRWLEDDMSPETAEWVAAENKITEDYLSKIPYRNQIRERLTKMWNFPKYGVPFHEGPWYFFFKNDGLQNQSVMYVRKGIDGEVRTLLDPNKLSEDGTVALEGYSASKDGKYLAYSIARSGSDWTEIYVMEIESGKVLSDKLEWVKFSGMSWYKNGFYYSRYDKPEGSALSKQNENHKVFYHVAGTDQAKDQLVYQNPSQPKRNYSGQVTEDDRFLLIYESETTSGNGLYFKDLTRPGTEFRQLAKGFDYEYGVVDNVGEKLLVMTNDHAPRKKLVLMDPEKPEPANWQTIIPEKEEVMEGASLAGGKLVTTYMKDAASKAYVYDMTGKFLSELKLPGIGAFSGFSAKKEDKVAFYGYTSFTFPSTVYKYNTETGVSEVYYKPDIDFNADNFEVKQVFYPSTDGTQIPMFIIHKKGLQLNGNNPTLLYGYGGFNISLTPAFSISRLVFLENGGVYAMANLRGGGEYGEEWHKAGTKERKQNVFDDFISAAQYLIDQKYTSSAKLAIMGGSNGGLLVGACMTQRPDMFKVAIPQVGVMDMLRYHKFTIGHAWAGDYGTSDTKEGFDYLIKYSPLHNLKKGVQYPATLAFTADHDDRVVPAHTFKFMATLQEDQTGPNPVLVRIESKAGHGGGKPTAKLINEVTDLWSFIFYNLGMKVEH
ncbi:MAG: prolyl oligopeptidase family serine peptidase [Syntrophothermus sp.]